MCLEKLDLTSIEVIKSSHALPATTRTNKKRLHFDNKLQYLYYNYDPNMIYSSSCDRNCVFVID